LGVSIKRKAQTDRRPAREHGIEVREGSAGPFPFRLDRVDPQIEWRACRQRCGFGYALLAEDAGEMGIEPLRVIARDPRWRTGETVHQAPILERIRRRTTLCLDVGDHFDGRGNASAGRHQIPSRMRIMKISHMIVRTNAPSPNTGPRRFTSLSVTWM